MGNGEDTKCKVYVRLPIKIEEELVIKNLHPDIETVQLPRQKSRRWCFIIFKNKDIQKNVVEHLKKQKINGKKIVVKEFESVSSLEVNHIFLPTKD